jgi:hypothetical protein
VVLASNDPTEDRWITFDFALPAGSGDIEAVGSEATLVYPHDWRMVDLGSIATLLERRKMVQAGKFRFAVLSAKALPVGAGQVTVEVALDFDSELLVPLDEIYLVTKDGRSAWRGPRWETARQATRTCSFGPLPEAEFGTLELRIRAPSKVIRKRVKHSLDLRD